jgi:hypothetical protein
MFTATLRPFGASGGKPLEDPLAALPKQHDRSLE